MKKIISMAVAFALTSALFAQNKKGNWAVGVGVGGGSFSFGKTESTSSGSPSVSKTDNKGFNIYINPSAGYYVSDNVLIGTYLGLGFNSYKYENTSTGSTITSENKNHYMYLTLSPYGRFYFGGNSNGSPYVEVDAGTSFYPAFKGTYSPSSGNGYKWNYDKYNSWNAGLQIGYEHFINQVVGIQYYIGYNYSWYKYKVFYDNATGTDYSYTDKNQTNYINFGAGLQIHLQCNKKKK